MGSRHRTATRSSFTTLPSSMGFAEKGAAENGQVNFLDWHCSGGAELKLLVLNVTIRVEDQTGRDK